MTCCTIGGTEMDYLFVTTAQDESMGGEVYVHPLDVKGEFVNRYGK